ncbi:MAG: SAM-dependent methyltransferase, partial [Thermoleophilia bacterium]
MSGPERSAAPGDDVAAFWDGRYRAGGELWGDTPSELAAVAVERLGALGPAAARLTLLDLGCGYGRDAVALWRALGRAVVGLDGGARAIEM